MQVKICGLFLIHGELCKRVQNSEYTETYTNTYIPTKNKMKNKNNKNSAAVNMTINNIKCEK